jgi:uncharacterized C2H2 Zn-finger protein
MKSIRNNKKENNTMIKNEVINGILIEDTKSVFCTKCEIIVSSGLPFPTIGNTLRCSSCNVVVTISEVFSKEVMLLHLQKITRSKEKENIKEKEKPMKKQKQKRYVLIKDIVIPAGTVFNQAPVKTERSDCYFQHVVGLSDNTSGDFNYCIDEQEELKEYFVELKE